MFLIEAWSLVVLPGLWNGLAGRDAQYSGRIPDVTSVSPVVYVHEESNLRADVRIPLMKAGTNDGG